MGVGFCHIKKPLNASPPAYGGDCPAASYPPLPCCLCPSHPSYTSGYIGGGQAMGGDVMGYFLNAS